jgi:predicted nucleic acid-binding protein
MVIFLDTSTLVKLYFKEPDSEQLVNAVSQIADDIFLFELAKVEFTSAIWKKVRTGDMDQETALQVISCFENDYEAFSWIFADSTIVEISKNLFQKYGLTSLRTLDALQLGACISAKSEIDVFLTNDAFLKELFEKEGLKTTLER